MTDMAIGDEIGNLSIAVTRDILQRCLSVGAFCKPLYGHNGEKLVDSPAVGKALEKRKVAEIFIG